MSPPLWRTNGPTMDHSKIQRPFSKRTGNPVARQPAAPVVALREQTAYSSLPEIGFQLKNLQTGTTTLDIYESFKEHGSIVYIEIFQNSDGLRNGRGRIKFSPPPMTAFWEHLDRFNNYRIKKGDDSTYYHARVQVDGGQFQNRGPLKIRSPLHPMVWYDAKMKLVPAALQFGVMVELKSPTGLQKIWIRMRALLISPTLKCRWTLCSTTIKK